AAEADAKTRAEAETRAKADADRKRNAEAAEIALGLTSTDRQRLQVALTALGYDTRGSDGAFGPRTREMIASWQAKRSEPATGFLASHQQQALLRDAASAVGKFDEVQKKAQEDAKAASVAAASARAAPPPAQQQAAAAPAPAATAGSVPYDGRWSGMVELANGHAQPISATLQNGAGRGGFRNARCGGDVTFDIAITPDGKFTVVFAGYNNQCQQVTNTFNGVVRNNVLTFHFQRGGATFTLRR
ncbi:MAG: peptidoglycan-binding domain-containing protein, partial [Pseudomonadota bacterium]